MGYLLKDSEVLQYPVGGVTQVTTVQFRDKMTQNWMSPFNNNALVSDSFPPSDNRNSSVSSRKGARDKHERVPSANRPYGMKAG